MERKRSGTSEIVEKTCLLDCSGKTYFSERPLLALYHRTGTNLGESGISPPSQSDCPLPLRDRIGPPTALSTQQARLKVLDRHQLRSFPRTTPREEERRLSASRLGQSEPS